MPASPVVRVVEREARVFRRLWRGTAFTSFVNPLLFLAAMGLGLGGLVDDRHNGLGGMSYLVFVTPGLLAASTMQTAAGESLWAVLAGMKWIRFFHGVVATPVSAGAVLTGKLLWIAVRTGLASAAFLLIGALLGGVPSWWGVLAVPAAVLCGLAFAAPLNAYAATQETDLTFPVVIRLGVMPLFLFSGTFFPVRQLPGAIRPLAWLSPLWHGVELCRAATTGHVHWGAAAAHVAILCACIAAGWRWGVRTFTDRLTP